MGAAAANRPPATWRLCTPASRPGAIAAIQVLGDVGRALARLGIAQVAVGRLALRDLAGIDRGVVARFREDVVLLMPHGGPEIVRRLCAELTAAGIERCGEGESAPAFPEARSAFEARLLATVARAASPMAIDLLLDQPRRWAELGLPDPLPQTPAPDAAHSAALSRLVDPPLVVAVGVSNIGKSTLLNRLAGRTVAAVADEPGTTRDHVGAFVDLDGLVVRWVDTPGLRRDAPDVEREAASAAAGLLAAADLVVQLGDAASPAPETLSGLGAVHVALRADLGRPAWPADAAVSAVTGQGMGPLVSLLRRSLVPEEALASPLPWRFWDTPGPTLPPGP